MSKQKHQYKVAMLSGGFEPPPYQFNYRVQKTRFPCLLPTITGRYRCIRNCWSFPSLV